MRRPRFVPAHRGFAHVVEERAQGERLGGARGELLQEEQRVGEDVALRVEVGGLLDAAHRRDLGQDDRQESRGLEQLEAPAGATLDEDLDDLVPDALGRDVGEVRGRGHDRRVGRGVDCESEPGSEAHGAEHPQAVLVDARARVADRADHPGAKVVGAADEVDDAVGERVPEERVDGEVAPARILLRRAEVDAARAASVDVGVVGAEGGDFEARAAVQDEDDAELRADRDGSGKEGLYGLGRGVGRDVVVERLPAEEAIAHASAGEVGVVPGVAQAPEDLSRRAEDVHWGT